MTTIADIYKGAEPFLNSIIKNEMIAQGHHLTGAMEDSLDSDVKKTGKADIMEGVSVYYTQWVNDGFPASSASWKQFPFLVEYFKARGVTGENDRDAKGAAAATIQKWMKEGMPTQASKAHSSTGSRTHLVENAFAGNESKIDEYFLNGFDFVVEEKFKKEKSEKI